MPNTKISKKQHTANKENAQKSTGARTDDGKKISARNAVKFGLHANDIIINSAYLKENRAEYEFLLESLYNTLSPATEFEEFLVIRMGQCLWRSRRAYIAETAIVNGQINDLDRHPTFNDLSEQLAEIPELPPDENIHDPMQEKRAEIAQARADIVRSKMIARPHFNMNILYYEMRLDRQLSRYYKILRSLQGKGELVEAEVFGD